jgi:DNA-binding GntR family transcriptional regulator
MMLRGVEKLEPVNKETTASIIAAQIRARIMDGTFSPGSQLGEAQLAARLNVSRGPVREALQRLIQEGLLENRRNRGVFVIALNDDDIADIYLVRGTIEREAAKVLMRRGDGRAIDRLEEQVDRMSVVAKQGEWRELADLDLHFHESLVLAAGSKRLQRVFGTVLVETRMCLERLESAYPVPEELVEEHRNVLVAMREGNESKVMEIIDAHLRAAVEDLTRKTRPA